jgi:hypothetical protein
MFTFSARSRPTPMRMVWDDHDTNYHRFEMRAFCNKNRAERPHLLVLISP